MMASTTEDREERAPCASPPSSGPRAKRQRLSQAQDDGNRGLPGEIWGKVMEFLPLNSVLSSAVVSRDILRAMAFVKIIHIDHSSQMHVVLASRHIAVIEVRIHSLFWTNHEEDDGAPIIRVDYECSERIVPFLTRFAKLQRVAFDPPSKVGKHYYENEDLGVTSGGAITDVIDSISRAYRCGFFSAGVQVFGLSCPDSHDGVRKGPRRGRCATCHNACRRFPLHHVVDFECRGSSLMKVKMGRPHGLDVCIPRPRLDENIKDRPGGEEMLYSKDRILKLLGAGSRYMFTPDDGGRILELVQFSGDELLYLQSTIEHSPHDIGKLSSQVVYDAITGCLLMDGHDPIHPTNIICYLVQESYNFLKHEIGLQLDEDIFYGCPQEMVKFLPQISHAIQNQSEGGDMALVASTSFMRHLVQINSSCIIQPDMTSVMIKEIADGPESNGLVRYQVMQTINVLLEKGSSEYVNFLEGPNASLLAKILAHLIDEPPCVKAVELGIHMLHRHFIAKDNVQAVIELKYARTLAKLLNSPSVVISDLAMQSLGGIVDNMVQTDLFTCAAFLRDRLLEPLLERIGKSTNENASILQTGTRILMLLSTRSLHHHLCLHWKLNPTLETLSNLLLTEDDVVLKNCSTAVMNILKDIALNKSPSACSMNADVKLQICSHFGKLATNPLVQDVVLEGICWIAKDRSSHELLRDVLPCIKVFVASANEAAALHTCRAVYSIMDCPTWKLSESRVQVVIDSDLIPLLSNALGDERSNVQKEALRCIFQITKIGSQSQCIHLVTQVCIGRLFDIIVRGDTHNELVTHALRSLTNILLAMENKSADIKKIVAIIGRFLSDISDLEQQRKRMDFLEKNTAWVVVETKAKEAQLSQQIRDSLERQEIEVQLQITCSQSVAGRSRPPDNGVLADRLIEINAEFEEADAECRLKKAEIAKLTSEAEAIVPKKEWQGRLRKGDLPSDLGALEKALEETKQQIETTSSSLKARKEEVASAASQLKELLWEK